MHRLFVAIRPPAAPAAFALTSRRTAGVRVPTPMLPLEEKMVSALLGAFGATRKGIVKKSIFREYDSSRKEGIIAVNLKEGDEVVKVQPTSGNDDILLISRLGMSLRFTAVGKETRLDLVHTGWERLGKAARKTRNGYTLGWNYVLRRWAGQPPSMLDRLLNGLAAVATMISRRPPVTNVTPP